MPVRLNAWQLARYSEADFLIFMRRTIIACIGVLLNVLFFGYSSAEYIDQFIVEMDVSPENSVQITEKILYDFESENRHGIIRFIPVSVLSPYGTIDLSFELLSVTDETGNPLSYSESGYGKEEIKIGDPDTTITGKHWYVITYRMSPAVLGYKDHDELYFDATGNEWSVPINRAEVTVRIPSGNTRQTSKVACYTGYTGSSLSDCTAEAVTPQEFHFEAEGLGPYEGITIVAGFKKGIIAIPSHVQVLTSEGVQGEILIDGKTTGSLTPKGFFLDPGDYTITVRKDLFETGENVVLEEGEWENLQISLRDASILLVSTDPFFAKIFVDGKLLSGRTPYSAYVPSGHHVIRVERFRYKAVEKEVTLRKGEKQSVDFQLEKTALAIFFDYYFPVLLVLILSYLFSRRWWKYGKDPKGKGAEYVRYEPPENMTAGELGVLADEKIQLRDISASIIDLAVKGFLSIKKMETDDDFQFSREKDFENDETLLNYEKEILRALFPGEKVQTLLSSLTNKFYVNLRTIESALYEDIVEKGYFESRPDKAGAGFSVAAILFLTLGLIIGGILWGFSGNMTYFVSTLILGIESIVFASIMPKKTMKGVEALEHIRGFRIFLVSTEKKMIDFLNDPKTFKGIFEQYLPYAIAMKAEEKWAKKFENIFTKKPDWYDSKGAFHVSAFTQSIATLTRSQESTFVSRPSQSSSSSSWSGGSGFSGGSSGGGFGGGGGSSW